MGAGFSKVIEALVQPLMMVFMAVLESIIPAVVQLLGLIVSAILIALLEPIKLIMISLIDANVLYPFIALAMIIIEFTKLVLARLISVPVLLMRLIIWVVVLAVSKVGVVYSAFYKFVLAAERDPRAYYLNPYYFDTIYKSFPSFDAYAAAGHRLDNDLFMNDDVSVLVGVIKPVRDPNFRVTDGYTCEYVGDKTPAYTPHVKMMRDFMKSRYRQMVMMGVAGKEVERAHDELLKSDDPTPLPSRFSENWEHIMDHMRLNECVITDSAYLIENYVGLDYTNITHVMGFGDLGAQAYIRDAVAPYMVGSSIVPSITNVSESNIASGGVPLGTGLTDGVPTRGFLDRLAVEGAVSLMEKVAICVTLSIIVTLVHHRMVSTDGLLEIY